MGATMGEIRRLPSAEQAEREASEWIARLQADDVSVEDRARFAAWREAHPLHVKMYDELAATWKELESAGPLVRAVNFGQEMNAAATPPTRPRWQALAAAAVGAVALASVSLSFYFQKEDTGFQTGRRGGRPRLPCRMAPRSTLVNTNSRIRVQRYNQSTRVIPISIRARPFSRWPIDTKRPFWVRAGGSWQVRAVGIGPSMFTSARAGLK